MAHKERCQSHMDTASWGRGEFDSRGFQKILCRKCRSFIGWCPPPEQTKKRRKSKAQNALIDNKNQPYE